MRCFVGLHLTTKSRIRNWAIPSVPRPYSTAKKDRYLSPGARSRLCSTSEKRRENRMARTHRICFYASALIRCYSFFWLICTTARPPVNTFRLTAPLLDAGMSNPKVRRATVSIYSTCELRERLSSASRDSK